MAIKNIIANGIGFSPGSVKYIPTHGFTVGAAVLIVSPLKSLVLDIGGGLGMTLMPSGNHLPITVATTIPSGEPPGDKGVIFVVTGGTPKIYAWDGSNWVVNN